MVLGDLISILFFFCVKVLISRIFDLVRTSQKKNSKNYEDFLKIYFCAYDEYLLMVYGFYILIKFSMYFCVIEFFEINHKITLLFV